MQYIQSVGILGLGGFGQLAAALVPESVSVLGFDKSSNVHNSSTGRVCCAQFDDVVQADVLLLAIPLHAYQAVLPQISPRLRQDTLVIDVCSVKIKPTQLLQKHLPDHPHMLITHPLFGPQSAAHGDTAGRELIVTVSRGAKADAVLAYCSGTLGLVIRHTTAEEHDRAMAQVHALTFFLAHGLTRAKVGEEVPFVTPSFNALLNLIALDKSHTKALFDTIQGGNPYAQEARETLLRSLQDIDNELQGASHEPTDDST